MSRPKLTLYFDLHSPYSYLVFHALENSSLARQCDITYTPVLLVAFIKAIGLNPPWSSANKVRWMWTDLARWARECDIPWKDGVPANYPAAATTLKVQRTMAACSQVCPERVPELLAALYHAFWVEKKGIQLPQVYEPVVTSTLGDEMASRVIARSSSDEVKALLRRNTDEAIASGAPGVPWIQATDAQGREEYFWGFDHLGQVVRFLGLEGHRFRGPHL